jgi:hypothetical protein
MKLRVSYSSGLIAVAWNTVSATGSGGEARMDWVEDRRLYLPSTGQVGDPLYSDTGEAVLTLKRPIGE